MSGKIILTVKKGDMSGKTFTYEGKEALILGRLDDCAIVLPETTVSRYHCLIDIAPPSVMVRDFGSLNGTYLNGEKIGQRPKGVSAQEAWKNSENRGAEFSMKSGDRLGLGSDCEIMIEVQPGREEKKRPANRNCEVCGVSLSRENVPGICESCQKDPLKIVLFMLEQAQKKVGDAAELSDYRPIEELGKGGMGMVWLVEEKATGKRMALKTLIPEAEAHEPLREIFKREAAILGQLNHKNIVKQYKFGQCGISYFFVMEVCDGSLVDLISNSGGRLSVDLATNIMLQVLDGLIYAHSAPLSATKNGKTASVNGVVHRDLKPGNIFLNESGGNFTAKIGDFGLAKSFEIAGHSGHTFTGEKAGTPGFMPRQQISNFKYSKPPVDVWAAAASYYFMLTGYPPKDFSVGRDHISIALTSDPIPIRKRNSSVPEKLAKVIDRALTEKPDIGVQSAAELKKMIIGAR